MVHIYTGNGKGKTTAALGLALRAAGSGKKVFFGQFVKGMAYSEVSIINEKLPEIDHQLFGRKCFINRDPEEADFEAAGKGLEQVQSVLKERKYDLVVLDEINIALYYKLISIKDVTDLIENLPEETELVLTGRYAPEELIEKADLVTEMKEIKHYFKQDTKARKGIEF